MYRLDGVDPQCIPLKGNVKLTASCGSAVANVKALFRLWSYRFWKRHEGTIAKYERPMGSRARFHFVQHQNGSLPPSTVRRRHHAQCIGCVPQQRGQELRILA